MTDKDLQQRVASIETHVIYIREKLDCLATKNEVRIHRWLITGLFSAIGTLAYLILK